MNKSRRRTRHSLANEVEDHASGTMASVKGRAARVVARTDQVVRENPASSALVMFAIGCGLGVFAALLLTPARRREPAWHESAWSRFSRSRLAGAVERLVPEAVAQYLARRH